MSFYISLLHSFLPSLFLSTVIILTGLSHSTHWPYIVLSPSPIFKSSTPTRLIKRGLKQKTTNCNDGGNGDDDEAPEHHHYSSAEFLQVRVEWDIITASLHSTLRLPSPQLGLCEEQRFRASYTSVDTSFKLDTLFRSSNKNVTWKEVTLPPPPPVESVAWTCKAVM